MLKLEHWQEKSESSLEASWILLENNLNSLQKKTLQEFKKRLAEALPKVRLERARAYSEDIIELHIEFDKYTYKNGLKAATVATDVEEETGVTIILL